MRKPPWIPFFLLKVFVPSGVREFFLGDIEEQFQLIAADQDGQRANRWFWKQTINSLVPLLGLSAKKNLQLSIYRVIAILVVILPVVATSPLKKYSSNYYSNEPSAYYSPTEVMGLLFAAFALGFLCRMIIRNVRYIATTAIALIIFTISLVIRGDLLELPWLLILVTIFVSVGTGLATIIYNRNSPDPKIRA